MARSPNPLIVALGLFTTIPVPSVAAIDRRLTGRAMAAFPLVGLVVGVLSGAMMFAVGWLGGPLLGAVLGLATLAALTGALHLDGLADTADGLGSRKPADQALEIMRRSDIGPMGVISLLFVSLADVAALTRLMADAPLVGPLALVSAAMLGRIAVVAATTPANTGARTTGFGALFYGVTSTMTATLWGIAGLATAGAVGWVAAGLTGAGVFGVAAVVSLGTGWWWRGHLSRRFGGMTGDTFGSIIEVVMVGFLVAATLGFGIVSLL